MRVTRFSLVALAVLSAACAHRNPPPESDVVVFQPRAKRNPNVITQAELQDPSITSRDAYTALRHLRPNFFTYRGPNSFMGDAGSTQISFDYGPLQSVANLTKMNTFGLVEVRYLTAEQAQNRFGLNANGGPVIVLLSSRDGQ